MTEKPAGDVSIVIPAYAEERRIGPTVRALCVYAREFPRLTEVLVIAEPSGDRTAEVARAAAGGDPLVRVVENTEHRGKGFAVRTGMLQAAGEILFFMYADLSVPLRYVGPFVAHLEAHAETAVAIGSRRHPARSWRPAGGSDGRPSRAPRRCTSRTGAGRPGTGSRAGAAGCPLPEPRR